MGKHAFVVLDCKECDTSAEGKHQLVKLLEGAQ